MKYLLLPFLLLSLLLLPACQHPLKTSYAIAITGQVSVETAIDLFKGLEAQGRVRQKDSILARKALETYKSSMRTYVAVAKEMSANGGEAVPGQLNAVINGLVQSHAELLAILSQYVTNINPKLSL